MEIADICDQASLQSWLADRPADDAIQIAIRCALRVFPVFASDMDRLWASKDDLTALPVLRTLMALGVDRNSPTPDVKAKSNAAFALVLGFSNAAYAANAAANASHGKDRAAFAARAAVAAANITRAPSAGADAARAFDDEGFIWEQVREDARMIERGQDTFKVRLWSIPQPPQFKQVDIATRAIWWSDPVGVWNFWERWWDGVLTGTPLNWELQRDILLELTEEDWQSGPALVAERIAAIELRYAFLRTPNAEAIRVNPETGFVRSDPVSHLRAEHLGDIIDTLIDASRVFQGHGGANGPYGAFEDECRIVQDAAERYIRRPIMLLRICRRVVERVKIKETNGDCPKDDPLVADFVSSIASAAGDLLAFDQDVRDAETARAASNSTPPSPSIAKALVFAADQSAGISEGDLKIELPADARLAILSPSTSEGQVALYQTKSRLLRLLEITKSNGKGAAGHIEQYPVVYTSLMAILLFLLA